MQRCAFGVRTVLSVQRPPPPAHWHSIRPRRPVWRGASIRREPSHSSTHSSHDVVVTFQISVDDMSSVREAAPSEVRLLSACLAEAFEGEPVTEWIGARHLNRRSRRQLMFMLDLEVQVFPNGGSAVTADDGHRGLAGVCLSLPPGRWEMPKTLDGRTTARFLRAYGFKLPRVIRMQRAMAERHPSEPHYYYRWIGVRPRLRGQGLGSALMRPTLDRCDNERLPAYLEASSELSTALYQRLGFVHQGVLQLPDGGPKLWPMWRPPRS